MKEQKPTNTLAIGVALALVIATTSAGVYFLVIKGPKELGGAVQEGTVETANEGYDLFRRIAKDIYDKLQFEPKVTIGSKTVHGPAARLNELVTASKTFEHTYTYEVSWAGSTKRLELKGDFTAKAGFPLDDSISLHIAEDGQTAMLRHPDPKILSCELTKLHVLDDKDGWWNKIKPEERESAQNELIRQARNAVGDSDLLATATEDLLDRLKPLGEKHSFDVTSEVLP